MSRRLMGAGTLALFIAAQAGALWHEATERHAICAEHGDVVELSGDGSHAPAADTHPVPILAADAALAEADHGHCELFLRRTDSSALSRQPVATLAPVSELSVAAVVIRSAPASTVDLLRLAPKSSPPA